MAASEDVDEERRDLPKQLSSLLDFAESRQRAFQAPAVSLVDLCCCVSSESGQFAFLLDRSLLERLGRAGLDLRMDLFPPEAMAEWPASLNSFKTERA